MQDFGPHTQLFSADTIKPARIAPDTDRKPERIARSFAARVAVHIWSWIYDLAMLLGSVVGIFGGLLTLAVYAGGNAPADIKGLLPIWGSGAIVLGAILVLAALRINKYIPQLPEKNR